MKPIQVAGLVPLSTVDWPGALAAVVFLQGCPWRCVFCHNEGILDPQAPGQVAWDAVTDLLERRAGLLDGVVFSGGEPTMQPALVAAAREVRARGFKVGLHTGGAYPARLRALVGAGKRERADGRKAVPSGDSSRTTSTQGGVVATSDGCALDWVGLDLKAPPHLYSDVIQAPGPAWERFSESFGVLASAGVEVEVRTTVTPGLCGEIERLVDAFADLADGNPTFENRSLVLQQARPDGAPASFAQALPEPREWAKTFGDTVDRARACGERRGVAITSR